MVKKLLIIIKNGVDVFVHWWLNQLSSLIPVEVKKYFQENINETKIFISNKKITIMPSSEVEAEDKEFFGSFDGLSEDKLFQKYLQENTEGLISIHLSEDLILERVVEFPKLIEKDYKNIIRLQLPSLLPTNINDIYFDCLPLNHKTDGEYADYQIAMIKKTYADKLINFFNSFNLSIKQISAGSKANGDSSFQFLNLEAQYKKKNETFTAGLVVGALILSFICANLLLSNYKERERVLISHLRTLSVETQEILSLKTEVDLLKQRKKIYEDRLNTVGFDQILEALTLSIPEDSWVFSYNQVNNKVRISGNTPDTSVLIQRMDQNPYFTNIENNSTTISAGQGNFIERYNINMDVIMDQTITRGENSE